MQLSAQDLYERFERAFDSQGITIRSWLELGTLDRDAWEAVARYVYTQQFPLKAEPL